MNECDIVYLVFQNGEKIGGLHKMSQEKVTKYKEAKATRKETMKKQKRAKLIRNSVMGILFAAVLVWLGYSAVDSFQKTQPPKEVEIDYTALDEYFDELNEE